MEIGQVFNIKDRNVISVTQNEDCVWSNYGFSRDLSRIVFSKTYRRLGGKTQVFPVEINEHAMNRMTHSLVVNNIAMDIATRLNNLKEGYNINLDLIQAIANGHDVGHTPFGHSGERTLDGICCDKKVKHKSFSRFKHNVFSIDILQNLDRINDLQRGYDLSWQTIDGILKHTELPTFDLDIYKNILKNRLFFSDVFIKNLKKIDPNVNSYINYKYPLTIEGQIVKAADEIAQNYHDMLDWSRIIGHDKFVGCISSIQSDDIRKINFKENCQYVSKFLSMFFSDSGELKINKINDRYNRDYFAWGIKELMISDIVEAIHRRITGNRNCIVHYDETNKHRFIFKNMLFVLDNGKVKINFFSDAVKVVSKNINDFGKKLIKSDLISKHDLEGENYIKDAFDILTKDSDKFVYHCKGTVLSIFSEFHVIEVINGEYNHIYANYKDLKKDIDSFCYIFYKKVSSHDSKISIGNLSDEELLDIFNTCVIKCLARMTDRFIKDLVNHKANS